MPSGWWNQIQEALRKNPDVLVAGAVVLMVVMMVIPLPTAVLDLLLALNLTMALLVLLVTMYMGEPLDFSIFPSLLLMTTLFRLALNVSSTRLILLQGYAGEIIRTFGQFVVGGNPLVGFVVFAILVVIQFVVITRGAERVAEVAARFTLDAMPGKQMSIDADLNAGLITDDEARKRRLDVEREADFYGAMDGASKFVKGDAIAGIVITIINLAGGFVTGVLQQGMGFSEALSTYSLLTVGDGLVSQIPALLISTATGIIVTRAASKENLGADLVAQLSSQPRALFIAAGVLLFFAVVPGLPRVPFLVLALVTGILAWTLGRSMVREKGGQKTLEEEREAGRRPEDVVSLIGVDPLEIELGYGLLSLADPGEEGNILDRVVSIRRRMATELGLLVPPIRIRDNLSLPASTYIIKLWGTEIARGELFLDKYLAMNPGTAQEEIEGLETKEPAFGLPALWITEKEREKAELAGYTVVDSGSVLATHLSEIIKTHGHELLGRQETKTLLDAVREDYPALVDELLPDGMSLGQIQKVLRNLLREGIPIRELVTILEVLADYAGTEHDIDLITEQVRQALRRTITSHFELDRGAVPVVTVDPELEQRILDSVERTPQGAHLALAPDEVDRIVQKTASLLEKVAAKGRQPVIVCAPVVRTYLRRLLERVFPKVVVLSYNEIESDVRLESVGVVSLG